MKDYSISHQLHPARREQLSGLNGIRYCLAANRKLMIGTSDVNDLYDRLKAEHPEAKLSKHKGYVLVEKS